MPRDQDANEKLLAETRERLKGIACALGKLIDRADVAGTFLYVWLALALEEWGDLKTAEYLRDLADSVHRADDVPSPHLHS